MPHSISRSPIDSWLASQCPDSPLPLPQRVEQAQFEALRNTLHYAAKFSPWYRHTLTNCNLNVTTQEELLQIPTISSNDLEEYRKFLCIPQGDVRRIVTLQTSGSTGFPKRIAFSENDLRRTASFFASGMSQLVHTGETLLVLLPGSQCPDGVADILKQALSPSNISVVAGNPDTTVQSLTEEIMQFRPQTLVIAPHQLEIINTAVHTNYAFRQLAQSINGIQCSGDVLDSDLRKNVENALHCTVLNHFGMTETCFGGGVECFAKYGYHIRAMDLFIEILNPEENIPVADGEIGEIVISTLNREAMPLIRYRTGDAASILTFPCACGSSMPRLSPLSGRYFNKHGKTFLRKVRKGGFYAGNFIPSLI